MPSTSPRVSAQTRKVEADLTDLEIRAKALRKSREEHFLQDLMGQRPDRTSIATKLRKNVLVPLSRQRATNGFLRKIGLLGRVQAARRALAREDLERAISIYEEWWEWETDWRLKLYFYDRGTGFPQPNGLQYIPQDGLALMTVAVIHA